MSNDSRSFTSRVAAEQSPPTLEDLAREDPEIFEHVYNLFQLAYSILSESPEYSSHPFTHHTQPSGAQYNEFLGILLEIEGIAENLKTPGIGNEKRTEALRKLGDFDADDFALLLEPTIDFLKEVCTQACIAEVFRPLNGETQHDVTINEPSKVGSILGAAWDSGDLHIPISDTISPKTLNNPTPGNYNFKSITPVHQLVANGIAQRKQAQEKGA